MERDKDNLEKSLGEESRQRRESQQEEVILKEFRRDDQKKIQHLGKKFYLTVTASAIIIAVIVTAYSLFVVQIVGQEYRVVNTGEIKSSYVIQNLQGDTIDTWLSWRIVEGDPIYVNVIDSTKYPGKIDLIKEVITSEKAIEIDDSLLNKGPKGSESVYYVGWKGALDKLSSKKTEFFIPSEFKIIESHSGQGDITITLTDDASGDGYSGYTKSIADPTQNRILKSDITIYKVDTLSDEQFKTILRHEFGHALGLAHSTAAEDLMHPVIKTEYPYISDCDMDAIVKLYDGGKSSQVVCKT